MSTPMLKISGVHTFYGTIEALQGRRPRSVAPGEIVTLIGANGAGKSTLLMTICGNPRAASRLDPFRGRGHHPRARPTRSSGAASPSRRKGGASSRA